MHQLQRTQIYLPYDLRREIDKARSLSGQSLAEYTRKALERSLLREQSVKTDLRKLANRVIGSLKISQGEAKQWIQEIRKDRKRADERLEARWAK